MASRQAARRGPGAAAGPADLAERQLAAAVQQLERERTRAARAERELARLRSLLAARETELAAVVGSTSWRITRPLRVLVRLARGEVGAGQVLQRIAPGAYRRLRPVWVRLKRAATTRPRSLRPRPEPPQVRFPLESALAAPAELAGAAPEPVDVAVSVVIPTYNAGHELYWLLRKLKGQRGLRRVEVVVVDSGSTDGTPELAEAHGCTVVRIPSADFTHSYARNVGADAASGDIFLFTVQDAYPIGDWWLHGLVQALRGGQAADERLAAVSCAEFPRRDSELLYNAAVDVHSRFLGCHGRDRVGAFAGEDHMALRTQGQVSDLACMVEAATFRRYRYEGRYAEDLFLGVRMIRDGLKVAMLSSLKVIHSHNRTAAYHLKRTFVDVVVLSEGFPDFVPPAARTVTGALMAAAAIARLIEDWRPEADETAGEALARVGEAARHAPADGRGATEPVEFGVPGLTAWLAAAAALELEDPAPDAADLAQIFADRVGGLAEFAGRTYGKVDGHLEAEIRAALRKTLAASVGAQLAFHYLHRSAAEPDALQELRALMFAGV